MRLLVFLILSTFLCDPLSAQATKAPLPLKPEDLCSIAGTVVRLADGSPLSKARLFLEDTVNAAHPVTTTTGADGRFQIKNLNPGHYRLTVFRVGFVSQQYGQKKPELPGSQLTLRPGQQLKDLPFRLIPAAAIAGHVLDDDGEPLPRVNVSASPDTYSNGKRAFGNYATVQTNDLGEYRLFGLAPGRYLISSFYSPWPGNEGPYNPISSDPASQGYPRMFYPSTPDLSRASSITVKPGDEIPSVDIMMRKVPVHRIRGHVFEQEAHFSANEVELMLRPRSNGQDWQSGRQIWADKRDGSFEITDVLSGPYTLIANGYHDGRSYRASIPLDVGDADIENLALNLLPPTTITGRITWDGPPALEGDQLMVHLSSNDSDPYSGSNAAVGPGGQFLLRHVSDGIHHVQLSGEARDCYIKEVRYGDSASPDGDITVARGAPVSLEITVSSRGALVQGTVTNSDNLPAAGIWAVLVPDKARRARDDLYQIGSTDQNGHFDLHGIAPGEYKLFSWEEVQQGVWQDPDFLKQFEDQGVTIDLRAGEQKTANLTAIPATSTAQQ